MLFLGDDSSPKSEIQYELLLKCIPIYGDQTVGPYVLLIGSFIGLLLSCFLLIAECQKSCEKQNCFQIWMLICHLTCSALFVFNMIVPLPYLKISGAILCGNLFDSFYHIAWGLLVMMVWKVVVAPHLQKQRATLVKFISVLLWILWIVLNIIMLIGSILEPFDADRFITLSLISFVLIDTFYAVSAVLIFCAMFNIMRKTIPRMKFVPGIESFRRSLIVFSLMMGLMTLLMITNMIMHICLFKVEDFISKPEEKEKCIPANRNNKSTCAAVLNRKSAFRFVTTVLPMLVFLVSFFIIYITQSSKKKRPRSSAASNSSKSGSSSSRSLQKTIPNSSQNSMHRTRIQSMQDEPMLLGLQEGNGDLSQSLHNPSLYFTGQSLSSSSSNDLYRSLSFESDLPHNPISEADQTISDSTKTTQRGSLDLSFLESGKTTVKKKKKKKKKNTSL